MKGILVSFLLASIALTGCASNQIILHPIEGTDIIAIEPDKSYTFKKSGFYMSSFYMSEVAKAKVESVKR